jgi:hypothetical protein
MALVERLMNIGTNDTDANRRIPVHDFFAAQSEVARDALTVANVKTFLAMDAATATEYDALIALAPIGNTTAARLGRLDYINQMHAVLVLAERRYPQYSTPAEVRLKLGI